MARMLITGASTGIGRATALALAPHGQVTATVRSSEAAAQLSEAADAAGVELEVAHLDVTDHAAVRALVADLEARGGISALIHNAGQGFVGTLEQLDLDDLRACFEVNFFAVAATVQAVLPGMRQRGAGRVVVVSSVGGAIGQPFNDAYCASKFAVEGLLESLAPVVRPHGIDVVVVEPGPVATQFVANVHGLGNPAAMAPDSPYATERDGYLARVGQSFANAQSSEEVAEVLCRAVLDPVVAPRVQTSAFAAGFVATKLTDLSGQAVQDLTSSWVAPAS